MLIRNIAIILSIGDGIGLLIESSTPSGVFGLSKDKNIMQYAEKRREKKKIEEKIILYIRIRKKYKTMFGYMFQNT